MKPVPLSRQLERAVLYRMAQGAEPLDTVRPEELSKLGQSLLASLAQLSKAGQLPASPSTLELVATESHGADVEEIRPYLQKLWREGERLKDANTTDVLASVRDQRLGTAVTNMVWEQLREGHLDTGAIVALLTRERKASTLEAASVILAKGVPPEVTGPPVKSLPRFNDASGGVHGRIVIGGLPNIGKSPLAWQVALSYGKVGPVLWYDLDDTGEAALLRRHYEIFKDKKVAAQAAKRIYIRDSIATMDADLRSFKKPALVVVDSIQALPVTLSKDRRLSLDSWLNRFKTVGKQGHSVILVSEVSRASYNEARISAFKETGEIEYAGTFCAQLTSADPSDMDEPTECHITKNRHRPRRKGHLFNLMPHPKREWWFREIEVDYEKDEEDEEL